MLASSYISPKAVKGQPSTIQGRRLVAVVPIGKGEIVAIKGVHVVDTATLRSLPERLRNSDIPIAEGFHLVALEDELTSSNPADLRGACTNVCCRCVTSPASRPAAPVVSDAIAPRPSTRRAVRVIRRLTG